MADFPPRTSESVNQFLCTLEKKHVILSNAKDDNSIELPNSQTGNFP